MAQAGGATPHASTGVSDQQAADRANRRRRLTALERRIAVAGAAKATARRNAYYRRALAVADLFAAAGALALSVQVLGDDRIRLATFLALPVVLVVSKVFGLYDRDDLVLHKTTIDEVPKLFTLASVYTLVVAIGESELITGHLGSDQLLAMWFVFFVSAFGFRSLARAWARSRTTAERCVVVGDPIDSGRLGQKLGTNRGIKAKVTTEIPLRPRREGEERWTVEGITGVIAFHRAERLILAPWTEGHDEILEMVRIAKGVGVHTSLLPGVFEVIGSSVEFDQLDGMTVLGLRGFELPRSSRAIKRAMDLAGSAVLLVIGAPALALAALAIRLDSRGPVFFRQTRVGRDGEQFEIVKFRTMVADAEALKAQLAEQNETSGLFKISDDPRVTRVGRFLRRTSLDELPQLLNVLRGEMSLVGPRPLVVDEDSLVEGWDRRRLHLTPGMTGPWQILGGGRIPLSEMVKIDYLYVTGWSLWEDVKILVRTAGYVLSRQSV